MDWASGRERNGTSGLALVDRRFTGLESLHELERDCDERTMSQSLSRSSLHPGPPGAFGGPHQPPGRRETGSRLPDDRDENTLTSPINAT